MIIWDATRIDNDEIFMAIPGHVTLIQQDFIEVACGKENKNFEVEFNNEIICPSLIIKSIRGKAVLNMRIFFKNNKALN